MAENSPLKQARAYHPYGRVKSPLRPSQQTVQPPTNTSSIATKMNSNYFSFSGGSSSLFPKVSSTSSRSAMAEVSSLANSSNVPKPRTFSIFNKTIGLFGAGGKPSTSIFTLGKSDSLVSQTQTKGSTESTVGAIGSRRPCAPITSGKPLTGTGFIPVQRSFKIWGDCDSNSNSMEFAEDIQPKEDENKSQVSVSAEEIHRSKSVRKNLFQQALEVPEVIDDRQKSRGILTERRHAVYDYPEYVTDIYNYFLEYERRMPIKAHYMSRQQDITHNMRCILVDWLVDVGQEYGFEDGTIFMAVGYVDRFLGKMAVARNKLQLVGITAMYIAAKCQEAEPPGITDVVHITDETYSKNQILIMEGIMLRTIEFDLLVPTTYDFLCCLGSLMALDSEVISLALYLGELSMIDGERFLRYSPSVIATAAVALSRYTHKNTFWDEDLERFSQVKYPQIRPVSADLVEAFYDAPTKDLTGVYEKYKSVRYNCASYTILRATLPPLETSSPVVFSI